MEGVRRVKAYLPAGTYLKVRRSVAGALMCARQGVQGVRGARVCNY